MFFNSLEFAIFLPIVFFLYWFVSRGNLKVQNIILLFSSYYFYACWDYRFLGLLLFSTFLDYFTGIKIQESSVPKMRKFWLVLSISVNLGFLGVFKYYNFFISSFAESLSFFGANVSYNTLNVILPVGISFYTFHGLSYIIDIYKNRIHAEKNFVSYSVFVSFFPLLVAGPIERATHLLPQIIQKRSFDYSRAIDGLRQILWGLFKKIVIADNCAHYANIIFNNSSDYSGSTLVLGALFFTVQIYCDFSGYSDIALGTARLFGIELLRNFAFPYFSRDIAEFWRRWHISLSSWFRDYVYIPLGGSKGSSWIKIRNIFIIFILSGFWHGANWTFIFWGALNAIYYLPLLLLKRNRQNMEIVAKNSLLPSGKEAFGILTTFTLTVFAWIFFRAQSLEQAFSYIGGIFSISLFNMPELISLRMIIIMLITVLFFITEWIQRDKQHALQFSVSQSARIKRWALYFVIATSIFWLAGNSQTFIYFQF